MRGSDTREEERHLWGGVTLVMGSDTCEEE